MVVCRNPTDPREHGVFTNADCDPGSQVFIGGGKYQRTAITSKRFCKIGDRDGTS